MKYDLTPWAVRLKHDRQFINENSSRKHILAMGNFSFHSALCSLNAECWNPKSLLESPALVLWSFICPFLFSDWWVGESQLVCTDQIHWASKENKIRDVDDLPRKGVAAFNTPQIELIDLLSKSYDGAILNLGMKPEFLPINSPFSSLDHAVSKFLFSDDNQFKWGNSCQTQCSNYIVRKGW